MNGNEFLDKMELVDDEYITQANEPVKTSRKIWLRFCAMAACCALVLALGYTVIQNSDFMVQPESRPLPPASSEPPKELPPYPDRLVLPSAELPAPVPFEWPKLEFDGMGYEGYWLNEISELQTGNPWNPEMQLDSLPVYHNALFSSEAQQAGKTDLETMRQLLLAVASRLGMDTETLEIKDNAAGEQERQEIEQKYSEAGMEPPDESTFGPSAVYCEAEGIRIEVHLDQSVRIEFKKPRSYPEPIRSAAPGLELLQKKAAYLMEQYADLLDMEQPAAAIRGGDYLTTMEQIYSLNVYDAAGSDLEKILHYNFYPVQFCDDDNGNLFLIRLEHPNLTQLLGNYPAITKEQAQQELLAGRYVTSVPYDSFTAENIAAVELVYRTESYDKLFVPYYKFYVDVTDAPEHSTAESMKGMREYGVYYVPAIDPEYLTSLPLWDGQIN